MSVYGLPDSYDHEYMEYLETRDCFECEICEGEFPEDELWFLGNRNVCENCHNEFLKIEDYEDNN